MTTSVRERLWRIIFLADTRAGKAFDIILLWMIGISVVVIMLETVKSYRAQYGDLFIVVEWIFTILFTVEYGVRLWVSKRPGRYATSFFGVVDLLSILPSYIALFFVDTHYFAVIRGLRMLRMFRVLKMARYMGQSRALLDALVNGWPKITVFFFGVANLVTIMGTMLYFLEGQVNPGFDSIPKSIYWAIVTITTVGYGDITPVTALGQALAAMMMIIGYAIIAVPTGIVGVELQRSERLSIRECPNCGAAGHSFSANYCRDCGAELPEQASAMPGLEGQTEGPPP